MRGKRFIIIILILIFAVSAIGCAGSADSGNSDPEQPDTVENGESGADGEAIKLYFDQDMPDVVMKINGQEIHKDKILTEYERMKILYSSVGVDIDSPEIQMVMQEALLSNTISTVLLSQEADKAGIVISDKQVEEKMDELISQYQSEEEFYAMLSDLNVSLEDFEKQVKDQLKITKFIEENTAQLIEANSNLDFTEEEKKQVYQMFNAKVGGMPDYEDMKDEVDTIFEDSKIEILVMDYIQDLADNSEIEFFLE